MKTNYTIALIALLFIQYSCTNPYSAENPKKEYFRINTEINESLIDSISKENYTYWFKNNEIVKLYVYEGDGENYASHKEFFIKDKKVIAYQINEIISPISVNYKALIFLNDGKISTEEFWIDDIKKDKKSILEYFKTNDLSFEENVTIEDKTKKFVGDLTITELMEVFGINYTSNAEESNYFNGSKLKTGERIIQVTYNQDLTITTNYGLYYRTKSLTVPNGKKWILVYAQDEYFFPSGSSVYEISEVSINGKIETFLTDFGGRNDGRNYFYSKNINIAKAKDENMKLYSGDVVFAISRRKVDDAVKYDRYGGEICFLEVND